MRTIVPKNAVLIPQYAECVFRGVIYDVYHWQQELFDGSFETFEMLKRPDTVKVLAVRDDRVVITKQEQPNLGTFYDLPGGRHDVETETELQAAQRELKEEAGLVCKTWKLLDAQQMHTKIDSIVYIFLATDVVETTSLQLDAGERIELVDMEVSEIKTWIGIRRMRYLPEELFRKVNTIEDLLNFSEFKEET